MPGNSEKDKATSTAVSSQEPNSGLINRHHPSAVGDKSSQASAAQLSLSNYLMKNPNETKWFDELSDLEKGEVQSKFNDSYSKYLADSVQASSVVLQKGYERVSQSTVGTIFRAIWKEMTGGASQAVEGDDDDDDDDYEQGGA